MKQIRLIEIKEKEVAIHDARDYFQYCSASGANFVFGGYDEIVDEGYETQNLEVRRVINNGVENYFAVSNEVWEALCLFDNPVTVESLIKERDKFKDSSRRWSQEAKRSAKYFNDAKEYFFNAGFLLRLKWLFTGVTWN